MIISNLYADTHTHKYIEHISSQYLKNKIKNRKISEENLNCFNFSSIQQTAQQNHG